MGTASSHQLAADRMLVRDARTLTAIKDVAKRYNFALEGPHSFLTAQTKVLKHLDNLANTPSSYHDQGSTAVEPVKCLQDIQEGPSPMQGRRLSYSQALGQCRKSSSLTPIGKVRKPVPVQPQLRSLASLHKPSHGPSLAAGQGGGSLPLPQGPSAVQWHPPSPAFEEEQPTASQQQDGRLAAMKATKKAAKQPTNPKTQQAADRSNSSTLEEWVASLEQLVQKQADQLAALSAEVGTLRQQLKVSHATGLSATQGVTTLQSAVDRLQDQSAHSQKLEEAVGRLTSQQQRLAEQQEREECQRSVVLKTPEPLPTSEPAAAVQELLCERLGIHVSVLRVRQLGQRGGNRTSYKVLLASSGERDAVLRAKAQCLRGTQLSIDVLLTKQQQARRKALLPTAKRAAEAGQRVQWRYDQLLIDGRECRGGSNASEQQQQQAGSDTEKGWQQVGRRRKGAVARPAVAAASAKEEGELPSSPASQPSLGHRRLECRHANLPSRPAGTTAPPPQARKARSGAAVGANQDATQDAAHAGSSLHGAREQRQSSKQQHGNGRGAAQQKPGQRKRGGGTCARPQPKTPSRA